MRLLEYIKLNAKYFLSLPKYLSTKREVKIMSIEETLEYMKQPGNCIVRFGDGEFAVLDGCHLANYQEYDAELQVQLARAVNATNMPNLLVCMPETLLGLKSFVNRSRKIWTINFAKNSASYIKYIDNKYLYGNSFVSRPYMIYKDKEKSKLWFESFRDVFRGKDIVLVEGRYSRNGVGNDLFSEVNSIRRILCPNTNAFAKYDEILKTVLQANKSDLILLAVGPTSKPLALALAERGYWALDIGHIDSEYEWYLKRAETKIDIPFKHTAEKSDDKIENCIDQSYIDSIIATIE